LVPGFEMRQVTTSENRLISVGSRQGAAGYVSAAMSG
jgi:hypothetical protein